MEIQDLIPVDWHNQRVLTTAQVAEHLNCKPSRIKDNFRLAKDQFQEGLHYFRVTGEELHLLKHSEGFAPLAISKMTSCLYLWTYQGCVRHCKMLNTPNALEILEELRVNYFEVQVPQVVEISGVHCYLNEKGDAFINAEDAARGLGFVDIHFAKSGERWESVRWARVNGYLRDLGCLKEGDPDIKSGDFISEVWFYLLAMKANNETAKKFQWKVAAEIMPSLRKYGYYAESKVEVPTLPAPEVIALKEEIKIMSNRLQNQFAKPCTDLAVVYVLLMSNLTVKIGMTKDLTDRIKQIQAETGLFVLDFDSTKFMPREDAVALEAALKEKFAPYAMGGEFFDVRFRDVIAQL